MSVVQSSQLVLKVQGSLWNAGLGTASDAVLLDYTQNFGHGSGAGLASGLYRAQRTLAASTGEDLDLSGALTDALGAAIAFTKLKAIVVHAAAGNTNNVVVGGVNTTVPLFADVSDKIAVKPGGTFVWVDPGANGVTVANGSADLLTITNSAGGTPVVFDIVLIGA